MTPLRARTSLSLALVFALSGCGSSSGDDTSSTGAGPGAGGAAGASGAGGAGAGGSAKGGAAGNAGGGTTGAGGGGAAGAGGSGGAASICDPTAAMDFVATNSPKTAQSCALSCPAACDEADKPWVCPALADYATIPHDCGASACGNWDGTYPTPQKGTCTVSDPTGDAAAKTSSTSTPPILPDGRRLVPHGSEYLFQDPGPVGTFPWAAMRVPGTRFVVVTDDGYDDHFLRVIDTDLLAAGKPPVVSQIQYPAPDSLNGGLAMTADGTLYAASGAPDSVVRGYTFDKSTGKVAHVKSLDIAIANEATPPAGVFPFSIAISPDGKSMVVGQAKSKDNLIFVHSLEQATYGKKLASIDLGGVAIGQEAVSIVFDPASSDVVYVSLWTGTSIAEVHLAAKTVKLIPTGKQPERIIFLDANYLAVADSLGDDISIVDRAAGTSTQVPIDSMAKHGSAPSSLAYDAQNHLLYATLAGRNGVAVLSVTPSTGAGSPPVLAPMGVLPTSWWPTEVVVDGPGELQPGGVTVLTGKGVGSGPITVASGKLYTGTIGEHMRGSVARFQAPDAATVTTETASWSAASVPAALSGAPKVTCPNPGTYDFPVPDTNDKGASKLIDHVFLIVRENKTYDDVMGDLPSADGDPSLVMAPGKMDTIWPNIRKIAQTFAHADNYYEDAEQSIQGHFWTSFGRSSDYTERTWLSTWARGTRGTPNQGVGAETQPMEGGIFAWLKANNIPSFNGGELIGGLDTVDPRYGYGSAPSTKPDTLHSCHIAARARSTCDLPPFVYAWMGNDHTFGADKNKPNPALCIAVNDEAAGMLLDGISHSPIWKSSLVIFIEDDPQDGADHVDAHRSLAVLASPWVRRQYVSHTHFDVPSIHKLVGNILGIPYNNQTVADAALPLDLFTSTPDYTPFTYQPRVFDDLSCNPGTGAEAERASRWDFSEPDDQPGLGQQVRRMLRGEVVDDD